MTEKLICPQCGGDELLVRKTDLFEDGEFIDDPVVGCVKCERIMRLSELTKIDTGSSGVLHLIGRR